MGTSQPGYRGLCLFLIMLAGLHHHNMPGSPRSSHCRSTLSSEAGLAPSVDLGQSEPGPAGPVLLLAGGADGAASHPATISSSRQPGQSHGRRASTEVFSLNLGRVCAKICQEMRI